MSDTAKMIFGLIGGLALFLYGMNSMSDALQKAAGERMKKILSFLTRNPVMGALAGALVTAVLQSSSATTVMVIGFTSAGLMSLPQAISVIFGANIGTTMTAQLMAFKISNYIYPIIFLGFILNFVSKKEKAKNIGMVIFSFGLLFEGIEIMGSVMKPLAGNAIFTDLMGQVARIPVLGVLLGAGMTLLVQSSSATIAVLQNFASQAGPDGVTSVIGLTGAIPILLGDNIGTTITALLASIGQSKDAKRTALAHSIFNISGSVVFACLIPVFARFVMMISPQGNEVDIISRQIANAHTSFNIATTLVWLPLIPLMVKIVSLLVRGQDRTEMDIAKPRYLDDNMLGQPVAAMYLISQEIERCSGYASSMLEALQESLIGKDSRSATETFETVHTTVKRLQDSIVSYITRLFSSGGLTEIQAEQTAGLMYVNNNIERIADRCSEICNVTRQIQTDGRSLSGDASTDLRQCFAISRSLFEQAIDSVRTGNTDAAEKVVRSRPEMQKAQKRFHKAHLNRVKLQTCDYSLLKDFSSILYGLDRIVDNCISIAEESIDRISFVSLGTVAADSQEHNNDHGGVK